MDGIQVLEANHIDAGQNIAVRTHHPLGEFQEDILTSVFVFGAGALILGLLCGVVGADRSAYRFEGVTLAIVLLVPRTNPPWQVAFHRFAEVSIGIGVALLFAIMWPEGEDPSPPK